MWKKLETIPDYLLEAQRAINADDFEEVDRLLRTRAASGDVEAQVSLGTAIFLMRPDSRDEAEYFLKLATEAGHPLAANNLATFYLSGPSPDHEKAEAAYRRAYELGFDLAPKPAWLEKKSDEQD